MTRYLESKEREGKRGDGEQWTRRVSMRPVRFPLFLIIPLLYLLTLARTPVLGDPTEYTYVAYVLGIAHPPGYAFYTLVGHLFQRLVPFGSVAWRMHLLSAVSGTIAAAAVFGVVSQLVNEPSEATSPPDTNRQTGLVIYWPPLFAALTVATAANIWQHSIHANPHIITATFLLVNLFLLSLWAREQRSTEAEGADRPRAILPLLLFSLSAGLGAAHHPLTVFSFPAYVLFILWVRPSILRDWPTLLKMIACAALGLSLFLYFPVRSPQLDSFWPQTMNTPNGFLAHVLARGLSDSLPYYSLSDQPLRAIVFWSILRLQYTPPIILLAALGLLALWLNKGQRSFALLLSLALLNNYAFVMSLKAQDIMAYILGPLMLIGLLAGIGLHALSHYVRRSLQLGWPPIFLLTVSFVLLGPVAQVVRNLPYISLTSYREGADHIDNVFTYFEGRGEGVVLLNNWEFMTPLWYERFVNNRWPNPADVRPEFVSAAQPWLPSVFNYLPGGPVYLNSYRREIVDAGFRLRPRGPFYQVVEPLGELSQQLPPELTAVQGIGDGIEVVGFKLPQTAAAGDFVPFTLAMRVPTPTADFYAPVLQVGDLHFPFTTDSHLVTPLWNAGEVIVERFDFALPHSLPTADYPVSLRIQNLSQNTDAGLRLNLGTLHLEGRLLPPNTDGLLANFRQRVGLRAAEAQHRLGRYSAPWGGENPILARPGDDIILLLEWQALDFAEESYTIFIHLNDLANRPVVDNLDYTPLGGAVPTHLWIPKWLPGQRLTDPYRLHIPEGLPAGIYYIEVGLYEMTSGRRLHAHNSEGNLVGDRFILGNVVVEN